MIADDSLFCFFKFLYLMGFGMCVICFAGLFSKNVGQTNSVYLNNLLFLF